MAKYELFHPDTEIIGQAILDFGEAVGNEQFQAFFDRHRLTDIQPDRWYPAQKWMDVLNDIDDTGKSMFDFVSIGIQQLQMAIMPPEFDTMPLIDILKSLEEAYQMNYRGTDIGGITAEIVDDKTVKMIIQSFEPDHLWYGNLHGLMRRFAPDGMEYTIAYDPDVPRREEGGDVTIIHVNWK